MYVKSLKELVYYVYNLIKKGTFWFSVKYIFWVIADKLRGVDYVKNEGYKKLSTDPKESSVFQATRDTKYLKEILENLNINSDDAILDLGCGKGYLLKIFSAYPFKKIGGVEISERLSIIAKENLQKEHITNYEIFNENAMTFNKYNNYNIIYMFNPFPSVVVRTVMKNIREANKNNKKITIIYHHPVCHADILADGYFKLYSKYKGKSTDYYIYCNKKN